MASDINTIAIMTKSACPTWGSANATKQAVTSQQESRVSTIKPYTERIIIMSIKSVSKLIAKRDGISFEEALEMVNDTMEEMDEALADGRLFEVDEILADNLGLEPDYIIDLWL